MYGQGIGSVHLSSLQCNGSESSLLDCVYDTSNSCLHHRDAGVMCNEGNMMNNYACMVAT